LYIAQFIYIKKEFHQLFVIKPHITSPYVTSNLKIILQCHVFLSVQAPAMADICIMRSSLQDNSMIQTICSNFISIPYHLCTS